MSTTDFLEEIKSRLMDEMMPVLRKRGDDMYRQRIKCATLSVSEAADYIGVSKFCLYQMVREKQIPHITVGSLSSKKPHIKFRLSTLDNWLEAQEQLNGSSNQNNE